jgi:uncharacterized membrane protein YgcG
MSQVEEVRGRPPRHRVHLPVSRVWRAVEMGIVVVAVVLAVVLPVFVFGPSEALPPCSTATPGRCVGAGKPYQGWVVVWVKPAVPSSKVGSVGALLRSQPHVGPCQYLDQLQANRLARRLLTSSISTLLPVHATPSLFECPLAWGASGAALRKTMAGDRAVFEVRFSARPLGAGGPGGTGGAGGRGGTGGPGGSGSRSSAGSSGVAQGVVSTTATVSRGSGS